MTDDERRRLSRIKGNLERRALINQFTRDFFREQGFLEVETPVRVPTVAPEPYITPYGSEDWFLSTSPELHMKRLMAAGYERLFQISRCFRKGERGRHHNSEFTMLEWYRAGSDYLQMIRDTENLVTLLAERLKLGRVMTYQGRKIDLTQPWPRISVSNAFQQFAGWDPINESDPFRFDTDLVTKVIPGLGQERPMVLTEYPAGMAALARIKPSDLRVAERAEIFIGGLELVNAYSELADATEQERRFREDIERIQKERGQKLVMPAIFLEAVAHLPACGGIALGMDRLVMLLCDAASIDEVMSFTADTA